MKVFEVTLKQINHNKTSLSHVKWVYVVIISVMYAGVSYGKASGSSI